MATHRHARINNALRVLTPVCQNALATEVEEEGGGGREDRATNDEVKIYTNIWREENRAKFAFWRQKNKKQKNAQPNR